MSKKPKIGRPKLPKGEFKEVFSLRLTVAEREAVDAAARKAGKGATEWAREAMLSVAGYTSTGS